jgi:hypothetical protein
VINSREIKTRLRQEFCFEIFLILNKSPKLVHGLRRLLRSQTKAKRERSKGIPRPGGDFIAPGKQELNSSEASCTKLKKKTELGCVFLKIKKSNYAKI